MEFEDLKWNVGHAKRPQVHSSCTRTEDFTAGDLRNVPLKEAIGNMILPLKGMGVTMSRVVEMVNCL